VLLNCEGQGFFTRQQPNDSMCGLARHAGSQGRRQQQQQEGTQNIQQC
jgi:hypothetical protein